MRRLLLAASLAGLTLAAPALSAAQTLGAALKVPLDSSVRVGFAGTARDLVVGNPAIADVTVLDANSALILGKGYGQTSVMAFDAAGRTVFSRQVVVVPAAENQVTYFRGAGTPSTYVCGDRCTSISAAASTPSATPPAGGAPTP